MILAFTAQVANEPSVAVELPDDVNTCVLCHATSEFWKDDKARLYIPPDALSNDVHFKRGVKCHNCHGGDPRTLDPARAHATTGKSSSDIPFGEMAKSCGKCHENEYAGLTRGVHGEAASESRIGKPITCLTCHGNKTHGIHPVNDPESYVYLANQTRVCGNCHENELAEYTKSGHGYGLFKAGLSTAVCADCHGAHEIRRAADPNSTLNVSNVANTCAKCHRFVKERLEKSVHGSGVGLGHETTSPAPGGKVKRHPSCTDCHQGHDLPDPEKGEFRLGLPGRCGNCHTDLLNSYNMSAHGQLTELAFAASAKCSDCHGGHDILPLADPRSRLAKGENRLATCRSCHPHAVANFANFIPHADKHDSTQFPILHAVFISMELLIYSVFAFFGIHTILWFVRSLWHVYRHGRPRRLTPGGPAYTRFQTMHRVLHAVVAVSFLGLALTGLPLRYSSQPWAHDLILFLGGYQSTSIWHRICGVGTILYFVTHITWLAKQAWLEKKKGTTWLSLVFGPDSPVPNPRDFLDILRMFRWFFGIGPKPVFERWTYWEKFDYWAVFWGVGIIGTSGLLLWFPNIFCIILPGETLNLAKIIHSEEALLATSFIFAIHFFGTHLRPEKFPIDMSVLSGLVSEDEMLEERPEFMERMRQQKQLNNIETIVPPRRQLILIALAGFTALTVGLFLLAGILKAIFG